MIRLFASDLDGTLLNEKHELDQVIEDSLKKVIDKGGIFSVATGRSPEMVNFGDLNEQIYRICMNGSAIFNPQNQLIHQEEIDKKVLYALLDQFPQMYFECITPTQTFLRQEKEEYLEVMINRRTPLSRPENWAKRFQDRVEHHMQFSCSNDSIVSQAICKVNCMVHDPRETKRLNDYLLTQGAGLRNAPSFQGGFEITKEGVHKGNAILWLAKHLGIREDEVAVYGDGGNDLEMLKMFSHSYAPNTASELALKCASAIIGPYQEHSVAKHMEQIITGKI